MVSPAVERFTRKPLVTAGIGFGVGLFFLALGFNRPSIWNMRAVDVIHLIAVGAWFGFGIVGLALFFLGRQKT